MLLWRFSVPLDLRTFRPGPKPVGVGPAGADEIVHRCVEAGTIVVNFDRATLQGAVTRAGAQRGRRGVRLACGAASGSTKPRQTCGQT